MESFKKEYWKEYKRNKAVFDEEMARAKSKFIEQAAIQIDLFQDEREAVEQAQKLAESFLKDFENNSGHEIEVCEVENDIDNVVWQYNYLVELHEIEDEPVVTGDGYSTPNQYIASGETVR